MPATKAKIPLARSADKPPAPIIKLEPLKRAKIQKKSMNLFKMEISRLGIKMIPSNIKGLGSK